ncbi:hypothetical protein VHEMI10045 [[Torrubiella] hemipterigena]|uniref:ER membrane protein complex subunit 2 n=1 Tax=[Torrubiella] hemipterigena TaxID=1531966 RepID=A0A0A1TBR0_9HYPO|nr:hypothetical protein VHEMI10045 [[Torrubiella] hemipterigena]
MTTSIVAGLPDREALALAQQAPTILRAHPRVFSASPLQPLISGPETSEIWTNYENLLLSCLRTGNDRAALECLERLTMRFGEKDERVMALEGLAKEAMAETDADLQAVLKDYDDIMKENDSNIPIAKRRVALLRSMGRTADAIAAVNALIEYDTTDAEAWAEAADMYLEEGLYSQAMFALDEVLALSPNAWNVHARAGEVLLMAVASSSEASPASQLTEAVKRFARSVELCDDYLRGYYGLKLATDKLLALPAKSKKTDGEGFEVPSPAALQKLNELSVKKLGDIVRHYTAGDQMWMGYNAGEIEAAKKLLEGTAAKVVR